MYCINKKIKIFKLIHQQLWVKAYLLYFLFHHEGSYSFMLNHNNEVC